MGILLFWLLCRVIACALLGLGVLWLGHRLKNTLAALLTAAAVYCLPPLLSLSGMKGGIEWLSSWPLFHAAAFLAVSDTSPFSLGWVPLLLAGLALLLIGAAVQYFSLAYESNG